MRSARIPRRRFARGIGLLVMAGILMLWGVTAAQLTHVTSLCFRIVHQSRQADELSAVRLHLLDRMQRDVWSAAEIRTAPGELLLLADDGQRVLWQVWEEDVMRFARSDDERETMRWPAASAGLSIEADEMGVWLNMPDIGRGQPARHRLLSQRRIAEGGQP